MKRIVFYTFALLLAIFAIVVAPSSAKPGSAPGTNGAYDVTFTGAFTGTGRIVIGGGKITVFNGSLTDENGAAVPFTITGALPLQLNDGRFNTTGTIAVPGKPVENITICGRVEPPDGKIVKKARLLGAFAGGPKTGTRVYGSR